MLQLGDLPQSSDVRTVEPKSGFCGNQFDMMLPATAATFNLDLFWKNGISWRFLFVHNVKISSCENYSTAAATLSPISITLKPRYSCKPLSTMYILPPRGSDLNWSELTWLQQQQQQEPSEGKSEYGKKLPENQYWLRCYAAMEKVLHLFSPPTHITTRSLTHIHEFAHTHTPQNWKCTH